MGEEGESNDNITSQASLARQRTLLGSSLFTLKASAISCMREGVMHCRHYINHLYGHSNILRRDYDEMIATVTSGTIVGGGLGHIWRGPRSIPMGMLVYGLLAATSQYTYTTFRRWRLKQGFELELASQLPPTPPKPSLLEQWKTMPRFRTSEGYPTDKSQDWDPVGALVKWVLGSFSEKFIPKTEQGDLDLGASAWWASPVLNAVDMEYRLRLNAQIEALEGQVSFLREKVELKLKEKDGATDGTSPSDKKL
ncbi:hypothetical protein HDU97_010172 [Phlyctochytrium planicorne]|nr:hypothetical protein HDU97_010172 [Phlyctochytrium planicorne]